MEFSLWNILNYKFHFFNRYRDVQYWFSHISQILIYSMFINIFWNKKWQHAPVFLPGKLHGQRSLVNRSNWPQKILSDFPCNFFFDPWVMFFSFFFFKSYLASKYLEIFLLFCGQRIYLAWPESFYIYWDLFMVYFGKFSCAF